MAGVRFDPVGPAVAESVTALREDGADVIIVVGHLEGGCSTENGWSPPESCEPDGELVEVLEAGAGQVDAVVLGHRHDVYANSVDGVAVVEAGSRGRALSRVDLYVDPANRRVDRSRTRVSSPILLCEATPAVGESCLARDAAGPWSPVSYAGREIAPDRQVDAILAPYVARVEALCAEPLAVAAVPLGRGSGESALGNLVADAMRSFRRGVDVAIINSGSLRADLAEGDLSYCDIYAMFPFDQRIVEMEVSGAELERILEYLTSGAHSMPQVSGALLTVAADGGTARDLDGDGEEADWERDRLLTVTDDRGLPFDPSGTYRFLSTDYITQRPGDAEFVFGQIPDQRTTPLSDGVRDAIVAKLRTVETPLGEGGQWPLPRRTSPRISIDRAEEPQK